VGTKFPVSDCRSDVQGNFKPYPSFIEHGEEPKNGSQSPFKFKHGWLLKDGFFEMVAEVWNKENKGVTPMQRWQNKIIRLRQFLRGWAKNMSGAYKKEKRELMRRAKEVDKKAETLLLSVANMAPFAICSS
jgi:hypothetical protein